MDARTVLRRAWNDSVWSKVIAAAITAALAGGLSILAGSSWGSLGTAPSQLLQRVAAPVTLPAWSLALGLVAAVLAGMSCRLWTRDNARRDTRDVDDIQPNAVPIVEARLFACPLESPTPTPSPVP